MSEPILTIIILVTVLGCGLIAGAFFAFSSFVMGALARLPAPYGVAAMQSINIVVINPIFLGALFGTAALCIGLLVVAAANWTAVESPWLLAASVIYLIGAILVTMVCNVPRNNALAELDPHAADSARHWAGYVRGWTGWNHVRAVAACAACAILAWALRLA